MSALEGGALAGGQQQGGGGTTVSGLTRQQVLDIVSANSNNLTIGNSLPSSPVAGAIHYISEDNSTVDAEDTNGDPVTEAFNGNLFRYNGSEWVFIYNFRNLIEFLIGVYSLYVGEYATRTAYEKNKIVTSGSDIFWTITAVADSNTTEPADNASFVQLNGGGGSSGVTAQQFLAAMPDELKVFDFELSPPFFDPINLLPEYESHITISSAGFSSAGVDATHVRLILTSISVNGTPVSLNGTDARPTISLNVTQRTTLKNYLETHSRVDLNIDFGAFVNGNFVSVYSHDTYIPRAELLKDELKVVDIEFSPPYVDPNNILSEYSAHVTTLQNAFKANMMRIRFTSQDYTGDNVSITGTQTDVSISLTDAQRAALKAYLENNSRIDVNIEFGTLQNGTFVLEYAHDFYIPRAEVLPYDSQIITFDPFPAFLNPENLPTRFGAQIVTLPESFYEVTDLVFAINGIAGTEFVFSTSDTRPYVDLDATQLASIKSLLSSLDELGIWVEFRDKDDNAVYTKQSIIPKQGIDIPDLREDVKQLQSHTGISTLQPTLRLHTPTRGKVMPAVFLEDELFVLESDSNASEEVNRVNMGYRRVDTGGFPAHRDYDGYVSANLGGEMTQTIGSSTSGMFAERRISALYQIDGVKIQLVAPATLFDASSITAETTELRITVRGLDHQIYHLQPDTFVDDDAATRTLNGVVYNVYTTVETPLRSLFESALQAQGPDGLPIGVAVQIVQEVSGVKQFLTGDTTPWATGNIHTAGIYMGDENGLPFEVEIRRKPNVLLAFDESRAYTELVLPEDYTKYNELFMIIEKSDNAYDVFMPTSALSADLTDKGHGPQAGYRFLWNSSTRTISRDGTSNARRFERIAYAELR